MHGNVHSATVEGFGEEWAAFDQAGLSAEERTRIFDGYFSLFPFDEVANGEGFDLGCGSGRWAAIVAPRVKLLHCIDASDKALAVARENVGSPNVSFHQASVDAIPLPDGSQDFGFSLGVLHHIPDTAAAIASCARKLKPGAPFLVYLYYSFENRPLWFRALWRASDIGRRMISALSFPLRKAACSVIAATVYWPLARIAQSPSWPLAFYKDKSFYTMRTDALDRFGTKLEQRFSRAQIRDMMHAAGLTDIRFNDGEPYWVAIGRKWT